MFSMVWYASKCQRLDKARALLSISKNLGSHVTTGIAALVLLAPCSPAYAADVVLACDQSPDPVTGYKVYVGNAPGTYGPPLNVGNQAAYTVAGLGPGTYYFAVTAYDNLGNESSYANEVFKTIQGEADTPPPATGFEASPSSGADSQESPLGRETWPFIMFSLRPRVPCRRLWQI